MGLTNPFDKEKLGSNPEKGIIDPGGASRIRNSFSNYPSQGLTPEFLTEIFRQADTGDMRTIMELFTEMEEKDAHLGSVLQTRKMTVSGLAFDVLPFSEDARDVEVAQFCDDALKAILNLEDGLFDILDAVGKGYSVTEIVWNTKSGKALIDGLRWWDQKAFTFLKQDGTVSEFPYLITDENQVYGEPLQPGKFIVHDARTRSGMVNRAGALRPIAWIYLFKNYTLKDWVILNERFANPFRLGKYMAGAGEADRKALKEAVFYLGTDSAAIISESTEIEIIESEGKKASAEMFEKLAEYVDKAMTKAVLGHTGAAESTSGKLGGENMAEEVRDDIVRADATALSSTLKRDVLTPLVVFNFGPDVPIPSVNFNFGEEEDLKELAETLNLLGETGITIPVAWVRQKFGIPAPEDGEETTKGVAREDNGNGNGNGNGEEEDDPDGDDE